jgi:MtrB/PioB family decaheme-associated outer membrane protein
MGARPGHGARCLLAGAALALAAAGVPGARRAAAEGSANGTIEVGGRTISGDWGSSKFEEYRDLRPGAFADGSLSLENGDRSHYFQAWLDDIGEADQRYLLQGGRYDFWRLELGYDELPHVFSNEARSLWFRQGSDALVLPDSLQSRLQALGATGGTALQSEGLGAALAGSPVRSLEFELREGHASFEAHPFDSLELLAGYGLQDRQGTRPSWLGFGSPGGHFVGSAAPIDERIHEVNGALRFVRDAYNVELGYTGSFFRNHLESLTVDNPIVAVDAPGAASRGQISLDPDNSAQTLRLAGAATLPLGFPAHASATVSYGWRRQNEDFLCPTVNTAFLVSPSGSCALLGSAGAVPLPATSLDGDVRTLFGQLVLTARPHSRLNLTARYRLYDYDNRTPALVFPAHVVNDQTLAEETRISVPNQYRRQNASFDASLRVWKGVTLRGAFLWELWDRSRDREVARLNEYGGRFALDAHPARWLQLRADYEFGIRRGSDYRTFAYLERTLLPSEVEAASQSGQFTELRKLDEADRDRRRVRLLAQIMPRPDLTLGLTGGYERNDYDATSYGLTNFEGWSVGVDADWQLLERLGIAAWYTWEDLEYHQRSRWRPRTFTPPVIVVDDFANDWSSRSSDQVQSAGLRVDLVIVPDRLDAGLGFEIEHARGTTRTDGVPGFVTAPPGAPGADGGAAFDFPTLADGFQALTTTLNYHVTDRITLRAQYRYERYDVTDFRHDDLDPFEPTSNVNGSGVVSPSLDVFLADRVGDYNAHLFAFSVLYEF